MKDYPSKIVSVKLRYFVQALVNEGLSIEQISQCIDWAEDVMDLDAKLASDGKVYDLVLRLS